MNGEYCYETGKACLTESAAQAIIDSGIYRNKTGHPRAYYLCEACGWHHLTSQTGGRYYRKNIRVKERVREPLTGDQEIS